MKLIKLIYEQSIISYNFQIINWYNKQPIISQDIKYLINLKKKKKNVLKNLKNDKFKRRRIIKELNKKIQTIMKDNFSKYIKSKIKNFYSNQSCIYDIISNKNGFNCINHKEINNENQIFINSTTNQYIFNQNEVLSHVSNHFTSIYSNYENKKKENSKKINQMNEKINNHIKKSTFLKDKHKKDILNSKFTIQELNHSINQLKNNKSCGIDNIYGEQIKLLPNHAKKCILDYFNMIKQNNMKLMYFPFKMSYIKLIQKNSDSYSIKNYRPITLISIFSKLLSLLILKRINSIHHSFISNYQSSFQIDKNTCINLFKFQYAPLT
jgi:hypothetical protein